jgi:type II secretory pathway pseudopilin PulG
MKLQNQVTGGGWQVTGTGRGGNLVTRHPSRVTGFTMVEIALCLAIIGFALVVIIGVLPFGMSEQGQNREKTIINQDATVLVEAIRNGARGADDLTNYVYQIVNFQTSYPALATTVSAYSNFTSGANIVGLLSTPEFMDSAYNPTNNLFSGGFSNHIVAYIRSMSGPAVEKPPQNNALLVQDSFTYRVICENMPLAVNTSVFSLPYSDPNRVYNDQLTANLRELQLTFLWPQLPNGNLPPQPWRQSYRTLIAGQLTGTTNGVPLYFFQPQFFTNAP